MDPLPRVGVHSASSPSAEESMSRSFRARIVVSSLLLAGASASSFADASGFAAETQQKTRVSGTVRDESNAITLPGIPVEVVGSGETVFTDVDGRYVVDLAPGTHQLKVVMEGYQEKVITVEIAPGTRNVTADVGLTMAKFAETVTVVADSPLSAVTSSQEVQLIERKNAQVITDNLGAQEMRQNADSDAAAAMSRVTGLSVVDNQYIFVRGLGERYSNTTLAGAIIPTTEPDKKVVPLDMFPASLLDSVQVNKSYSPDRSAEFAGGLVQIQPLKFPAQTVADFYYGYSRYETATGKPIPQSALDGHDVWGFDGGARTLPSIIPNSKIVRKGIYTPDVGFTADQITEFGRSFDNSTWWPVSEDGSPGQNWGGVYGSRLGNLGVVASVTHNYKEQYVDEVRRFFRIAEEGELEPVSDYVLQTGTQKAQLGIVGNVAYQFAPSQRIAVENFYSHSGRDEGRYFQGPNTDNARYYRNYRLQFIEEGLLSNSVTGEHFLQNWRNSRIDWRVNYAQASRDEPDLRETLYEALLTTAQQPAGAFTLADESQSGFRMFNELNDDTTDVAFNWSIFSTAGSRPTQYKFGANYVERTRDFVSRRFRYVPVVLNKSDPPAVQFDATLPPEQLYIDANIGTAFVFSETTRPVDAYDGDQSTFSGYGMVDVALTSRSRLVAGARIEDFEQTVNTFDPFGLFVRTIASENKNTDFFPAVNFVQALSGTTNLRFSYSSTVNRPEFRELAPFEFTDVVGNRAVRGNPDLDRALIQNVDARWEMFPGARNVFAASAFYKYFDQPIERVVISGAQPIVTFQNADNARNFGIELEASREIGPNVFFSANYTFVDSKITLRPDQRTVQTSAERPLAGQSKNLFNLTGEYAIGGFMARALVNYFGDRIYDVGANQAPDVVEEGRGSLDLVFSQRLRLFSVRFSIDNVTDSDYLFTQGTETQRLYKLGRSYQLTFGVSVF
jgi:outer membrane receptor protein involved in Fe transport